MADYLILPFRFERFDATEYFLSNEVGEFEFLNTTNFNSFVSQSLDMKSDSFLNLKSKQFLTDSKNIDSVTNMLATKFRTKKAF